MLNPLPAPDARIARYRDLRHPKSEPKMDQKRP
jgi:hypothetical protein